MLQLPSAPLAHKTPNRVNGRDASRASADVNVSLRHGGADVSGVRLNAAPSMDMLVVFIMVVPVLMPHFIMGVFMRMPL